jgi:hypothetical protein
MMLKRIYEDSSLTQMFAQIKETVSFKGIGIRISGTNGATAVQLADVGRIQYIKNGRTIIDAGFDALHALNHVLGGNPLDNTTGSGALDFYLYIPRRFNDNNVEMVVPSDDAQIKCTFNANLATRIASGGLIQVFLDLEEGSQKYDLAIRQYSESIAGASTNPVAYEQPNLLLVGLGATVSGVFTLVGSNLTQMTTQVGNQISDFDLATLQANTNAQLNLEADNLLLGVPYLAAGDINSRLHDNARMSFTTSGASVPETILMSALFDNKRLTHSRQIQSASLRRVITSKNNKGDVETVATVQRIVGRNVL